MWWLLYTHPVIHRCLLVNTHGTKQWSVFSNDGGELQGGRREMSLQARTSTEAAERWGNGYVLYVCILYVWSSVKFRNLSSTLSTTVLLFTISFMISVSSTFHSVTVFKCSVMNLILVLITCRLQCSHGTQSNLLIHIPVYKMFTIIKVSNRLHLCRHVFFLLFSVILVSLQSSAVQNEPDLISGTLSVAAINSSSKLLLSDLYFSMQTIITSSYIISFGGITKTWPNTSRTDRNLKLDQVLTWHNILFWW